MRIENLLVRQRIRINYFMNHFDDGELFMKYVGLNVFFCVCVCFVFRMNSEKGKFNSIKCKHGEEGGSKG